MQHEFNHARPTPLWGPRELPLGQGKPGTTPTSASDLSTNAEDFSSCRSPTTEVEDEPLRVPGKPTLGGSTAGQNSPALWGFCTPPSHTFGGPCQPSVRQRHPSSQARLSRVALSIQGHRGYPVSMNVCEKILLSTGDSVDIKFAKM